MRCSASRRGIQAPGRRGPPFAAASTSPLPPLNCPPAGLAALQTLPAACAPALALLPWPVCLPHAPCAPAPAAAQSYDPRAKLMRQVTYRVLEKLGRKDALLDIAMELEKIALQDEYFVKR